MPLCTKMHPNLSHDLNERQYFESDLEYQEWLELPEKKREEIIFQKISEAEQRRDREAAERRVFGHRKREDRTSSDEGPSTKKSCGLTADDIYSRDSRSPSPVTAFPGEKPTKQEQNELDFESIFGTGSNESDSDSSSSDSDSSSSSQSSDGSKKRKKLKKLDVNLNSSDQSDSDDEAETPSPKVENLADLIQVRLSRRKLEFAIYLPDFEKLVVNSYVGLVSNRSVLGRKLKIMQVVSVINGMKPYFVDSNKKLKSDKWLRLKSGNTEMKVAMNCISNGPFTRLAFQEWLDMARESNCVPNLTEIKAKQKQIMDILTKPLTAQSIEWTVKEKARLGMGHTNLAVLKGELIVKKKEALQNGDLQSAHKIQAEIDRIDIKNNMQNAVTSKWYQCMMAISEKNKHLNMKTTNERCPPPNKYSSVLKESTSDPDDDLIFRRKKGITKVTSRATLENMNKTSPEEEIDDECNDYNQNSNINELTESNQMTSMDNTSNSFTSSSASPTASIRKSGRVKVLPKPKGAIFELFEKLPPVHINFDKLPPAPRMDAGYDIKRVIEIPKERISVDKNGGAHSYTTPNDAKECPDAEDAMDLGYDGMDVMNVVHTMHEEMASGAISSPFAPYSPAV